MLCCVMPFCVMLCHAILFLSSHSFPISSLCFPFISIYSQPSPSLSFPPVLFSLFSPFLSLFPILSLSFIFPSSFLFPFLSFQLRPLDLLISFKVQCYYPIIKFLPPGLTFVKVVPLWIQTAQTGSLFQWLKTKSRVIKQCPNTVLKHL